MSALYIMNYDNFRLKMLKVKPVFIFRQFFSARATRQFIPRIKTPRFFNISKLNLQKLFSTVFIFNIHIGHPLIQQLSKKYLILKGTVDLITFFCSCHLANVLPAPLSQLRTTSSLNLTVLALAGMERLNNK